MIQSPGTARVQAGSPITIPMSSDKGAVTWAKTSGPAWLTFPDTALGECSGTAVAGQDGLLVVTATDADGVVDTAGVAVTVLPTGFQAVFDPVTAPAGETVRALPEVWGARGAVRWTKAVAPPGWTVDPQTGEAAGPMPAVSAGVVVWGRDLYGTVAQAALELTPRAAPPFDAFVEDTEEGLALAAGENVDRRIRAPGATPPLTVSLDAAPEWARVVQGTATEDPRLQGTVEAGANGLVVVGVTDADGGEALATAWAQVTDAPPLQLVLPESITDLAGDPLPPNLFARVLGGQGPYAVRVELPVPGVTFNPTTYQIGGSFPSTGGTEQLRLSVTDNVGNRAYATMNVVSTERFLVTYPPVNVAASGSVSASPTVAGTSDTVTYAKLDGPSWLTVNGTTGVITGTASAVAGSFIMRVVATTGALSYTASVRVTVTQGSVSCSIPAIAAQRGARGSVDVTITNAGTGFTVEKVSGPAWLNVFGFGLVSWNLTPGSTDARATDVTPLVLRVRRVGGGTSTCTVTPTIGTAPPPVTGSCSITGPASLPRGSSGVYSVIPSATASSYTLTEAGTGATIVSLGGGRYRVTATGAEGSTLSLSGTAVVGTATATCTRSVSVTAGVVPLQCTVPTLRFATGTAVSGTVTATGGSGGYTYAVRGLPSSVTMTTGGVLGGTAPAAGSYSFTVTVTDSNNASATCGGRLTVTQATITCSASPSFTGLINGSFGGTIPTPTNAGGVVTFVKATGPDWLFVSASGRVTGTFPGTTGSTTWSYRAQSPNGSCTGASGSLSYSLPALACSVGSASGETGSAVSVGVTATGGGGRYSFALTSGGSSFTLSGSTLTLAAQTSAGTFNYTITVTDANGTTATCSGSITITAPQPRMWFDPTISFSTGGHTYTPAAATMTLRRGQTYRLAIRVVPPLSPGELAMSYSGPGSQGYIAFGSVSGNVGYVTITIPSTWTPGTWSLVWEGHGTLVTTATITT